MNQPNKVLEYSMGNLVYKTEDLTFLFFKPDFEVTTSNIRVWWKDFDSEWNQGNLQTTIKRFRKFFELPQENNRK